ncbi:MAG: hypothetical protein HDR53_05145 [Treponema sp.]|nr:hypothetical protein [Treponema sp.]
MEARSYACGCIAIAEKFVVSVYFFKYSMNVVEWQAVTSQATLGERPSFMS